MSNTFTVSCEVSATSASVPLGLEIWIDEQQVFDSAYVQQDTVIAHKLADSEGEHELRFVMKNKQLEHTQIDSNGNIVSDACIVIKNIKFDEIELGDIVNQLAVYTHDFNGTGNTVQDQFYNIMGCNGTVSLKFSSPIYIWVLENL